MPDRTEAAIAAMTRALAPGRADLHAAVAGAQLRRALAHLPADVLAVLRGEMIAVRPELLEEAGRHWR